MDILEHFDEFVDDSLDRTSLAAVVVCKITNVEMKENFNSNVLQGKLNANFDVQMALVTKTTLCFSIK